MKKGCVLNDAPEILLACADIAAVKGRFDVVLANLDFAVFSRRAPEIVRLTAPRGYSSSQGLKRSMRRACRSCSSLSSSCGIAGCATGTASSFRKAAYLGIRE